LSDAPTGQISRESRTLSASIVTFNPDLTLVETTLRSLAAAVARAVHEGVLTSASVAVVDNGPGDGWAASLQRLVDTTLTSDGSLCGQVVSGQGNVGYGGGHNLGLQRANAPLHLVLNPDVELRDDALTEGLRFLESRPDVAIAAPQVVNQLGEPQFLCKRYPSVLDLGLRGFGPRWLRDRFDARLRRYELRDETSAGVSLDVPMVSGCFMLMRRSAIEAVGAFSPRYFVYFEDYDLSLRIGRIARLAFVPSIRIVHYGGRASRKGPWHVMLFVQGASRFFRDHGWRWW
jgi:GT2 family glycosyltransferase